MEDWGGLYGEHVVAVANLALALDEDLLGLHVPATPAWSVLDVLRHLAGSSTDSVTGRMDGAPGPEWSARHVGERVGLSVADLVAELRANVDPVAAAVAGLPRPATVWDIAVHHADLHEALDRAVLPRLWRPVLAVAAPMMLGELAVTVRAGGDTYGAGGPELEVAPYELFRALFSRRSRAQIDAWAGGTLTAEQLCIFGPREDEQPSPV